MTKILLLLLAAASRILGTVSPDVSGAYQSVVQLSVDEGLPHTDVTSVCQDADGFIWIGTLGGLCRYDGIEIKTFGLYDSALPSSRVSCLSAGREGNIYVGTENAGLCVFDTGKMSAAMNILTPSKKVNGLCLDEDNGVLWIFTDTGISSLALEGSSYSLNSWSTGYPVFGGCISENAQTPELLLATSAGLEYFRDGKFQAIPGIGYATSVNRESGSTYIVTSSRGTFRYDRSAGTFDCIDPFSSISSQIFPDGNIWIGTYADGIRFIGRDGSESGGLNFQVSEIRGFFQDKTGVVWIASIDKGCLLSSPNSRKFKCISVGNDKGSSIAALFADSASRLWISSRGKNLFCLSGGVLRGVDMESLGFAENTQVSSFFEDSSGDLWIGAWDKGYTIVPAGELNKAAAGKKFTSERHPEMPVSVFKFLQGGDRMYLSTNQGLRIVERDSRKQLAEYRFDPADPQSLPDDFCTDILQCGDTLWVGTRSGLAYVLSGKEDSVRRIQKGTFQGDFVSVLYKDKAGSFWICTLGGGLNRMVSCAGGSPQFEHVSISSNRLNNSEFESLQEDSAGNLWIGGPGLIKFNPVTGQSRHYAREDGLQSNVFKIWASAKFSDGRLAFGGPQGLNIFNPEDIGDENFTPETVITGIEVNGEEVSDISSLDHSCNNITFRFAALDYSSPERNVYRYRLWGAEKEFRSGSGNSNSATYLNLRPGRYTFVVRGSCNPDSKECWSEKSIMFRIRPPFYASLPSFLLYALVVLAIVYFILKNRREREERKRELERNANELRLHTDFLHEIKTPLTLIKTPVEELLDNPNLGKNTHSRLSLVLQSANVLQKHIDEITDLRKFDNGAVRLHSSEGDFAAFVKETSTLFQPVAESRNIRFIVNVPQEPLKMYFDRNQMEKVLFNLLSNAIKYSPRIGGQVKVNLTSDREYAVLSVSNLGHGILPEEIGGIFNRFARGSNSERGGMGIGLAISKYIVELHKGEISVNSVPGGETEFVLKLLLGSAHLLPCQICAKEDEHEPLQQNVGEYKPSCQTVGGNRQYNILVIEDNENLRAYFKDFLSPLYNVRTEDNGMSGYERAIADQPDLIISDVMMPEMNGFELCTRIKNNPDTSFIPLILVSAMDLPVHKMEGYSLLADDYITKPFRKDVLLSRISNLIRQRELMRESFKKNVRLDPSEVVGTSSDERFMKRCIECIESNISDHGYGVDELCRDLGISRPQLYRKLKAVSDLSPLHFLRSVRLKRAAQILSGEPGVNVGEVAELVGYTDQSYFTKLFFEQFGVLPKDYRK